MTGSTFGPCGIGPKYFVSSNFKFGLIKVSGDGEAGIVGRIELLEEVANVVEASSFDVGVRADDAGVVGMALGEELMIDLFFGEIIGCAFALPALVADDVALISQLLAVEAFEEKAHAVALEPEGEFELIAGHGLEVVGTVEVRGAVDVGCAGALDVLDVGLLANVFGALKHHVLEEMGEAGAASALVEGADVIPEVDGDERQAVVLMHQDDETVRHHEPFVLELGNLERLGRGERVGSTGDGCSNETGQQRDCERALGKGQRYFHLFSTEAGEVLGRVPAYSNR